MCANTVKLLVILHTITSDYEADLLLYTLYTLKFSITNHGDEDFESNIFIYCDIEIERLY